MNIFATMLIKQPLEFMQHISDAIRKQFKFDILKVHMGACMYLNDREYISNLQLPPDLDVMNYMGIGENTFNPDIMLKRSFEHFGWHPLFTKTLLSSCEHEYRFIWDIEYDTIPDYIDLELPNAVHLCQKIVKSDLVK